MNNKENATTDGQRAIGYQPIAQFVNRIMPMEDSDLEMFFPLL